MEEQIETRANATKVWQMWEKAHAGQKGIAEGEKGISHKTKYEILNVVPGTSFTILWKTLFVRLYFTHAVTPTRKGSLISYNVEIKGLFAKPVRWFLGEKIRRNLTMVLKTVAKQLES